MFEAKTTQKTIAQIRNLGKIKTVPERKTQYFQRKLSFVLFLISILRAPDISVWTSEFPP